MPGETGLKDKLVCHFKLMSDMVREFVYVAPFSLIEPFSAISAFQVFLLNYLSYLLPFHHKGFCGAKKISFIMYNPC